MGISLKRKKIVFLGLDNAGKTTFLPIIQNGSFIRLEPDMGKETAVLKFQNKSIKLIALTGKKEFRNLWEKEVINSDLIIFMLDAYDRKRFSEAREELEILSGILRKKPLIVLANKFDLHPEDSIENIENELNLIGDFEVIPISCKNGFGLVDAISKIYLKLMGKIISKKLQPETFTIFNRGGIPLTTQNGHYRDEDILKGGILFSIISLIKEFFNSDLKRIGTVEHNIFINRSKHFIASLTLKISIKFDYNEIDSILMSILEKLEGVNPELLSKNLNSIKLNLDLQQKLPITLINIRKAIKQRDGE